MGIAYGGLHQPRIRVNSGMDALGNFVQPYASMSRLTLIRRELKLAIGLGIPDLWVGR